MFGLGKIFGFVKMLMPVLQFIPPLAPLANLFRIAEAISSLVDTFKNGGNFLNMVSKFAPLPNIFNQVAGGSFGLDSSSIGSWKSLLSSSSPAYKALDLVNDAVSGWNRANAARNYPYLGTPGYFPSYQAGQ